MPTGNNRLHSLPIFKIVCVDTGMFLASDKCFDFLEKVRYGTKLNFRKLSDDEILIDPRTALCVTGNYGKIIESTKCVRD